MNIQISHDQPISLVEHQQLKQPKRYGFQETYIAMGQNPGTVREHQNRWDLWVFIPLKINDRGFDTHLYGHWIGFSRDKKYRKIPMIFMGKLLWFPVMFPFLSTH